MKTFTDQPSAHPHPAADFSSTAPCHDGFEGLTTKERALHAEILHRAHSIWENKGRPPDTQLADWLEAEQEVLSEK